MQPPSNLADLRTDCTLATLDEGGVDPDPYAQFGRWHADALRAAMPEPDAMTLATIGRDGRPAARIVLLRGFDPQGFVFYTSHGGGKAAQLAAHPQAALVFHWAELHRQVRIEGNVTPVDTAQADAFFATRSRSWRLAAWASPQSRAIAGVAELEARFAAVEAEFRDAGDAVPRPPHWGGYRLAPVALEFWQGRRSRRHDRVRYRRGAAGWIIDRLAP